MSQQVPSTGPISFSHLRNVFGGTNPIKFSSYFSDAPSRFTADISGIPASTSSISLAAFRGKNTTLYVFSNHTFTHAGATGSLGPTLAQCRSAYSAATWAQDTNYFNMTSQGIQLWKVPRTGTYRILCAGARGGSSLQDTVTAVGGNGAVMRGDFTLTRGTVVSLIVGQEGVTASGSGGGGGSFVWVNTDPLIIAGGGGSGGDSNQNGVFQGQPGLTGTSGGSSGNGTGVGGTNGSGGGATNSGGGGAGWFSNGSTARGGIRPLEGGTGGTGGVEGGFGGGGANGSTSPEGGGGGGGYSGGGGGNSTNDDAGGGGGSLNTGTNQSNVGGSNNGNGYITVTFIS